MEKVFFTVVLIFFLPAPYGLGASIVLGAILDRFDRIEAKLKREEPKPPVQDEQKLPVQHESTTAQPAPAKQ